MKTYNFGSREIVVTEDTVVVGREFFETLLMEHTMVWRRHLDEGVFGTTDETRYTAKKILREMEDVSYELLKDTNARREAKRAQMDIPF